MALDFLNQMGPAMGGIGSLLDIFGVGKPKQNYGPTPSEAQANSLFQALLDPNNSLVKEKTQQNLQKGMQDFLLQLKLMQMQGARQQARGMRNTFFNPERADETINYLTTRGIPGLTEIARNRATDDISSTASSLAGFGASERSDRDSQYGNQAADYSRLQGMGGFGGFGGKLGGGLTDLLGQLLGGTQVSQGFGPGAATAWSF